MDYRLERKITMAVKHIKAPITKDVIKELKVGDSVLISGVIYTARDAAHERMTRLFKEGRSSVICRISFRAGKKYSAKCGGETFKENCRRTAQT